MYSHAAISSWVSALATITTVGQFLSGIPSCRRIARNGTTGELSGLPFVAAFFSCGMWMHYGLLKRDVAITLVNFIGLVMQVAYIYVFRKYAVSKASIHQQIVASLGALGLIVVCTRFLSDSPEEAVLYTGFVCCLATCLFCAAPLATLASVVRSRSSESLNFFWILMTFLVCAEWLLYGYLIQDVFIQFPNFIGILLSGFQLSLFLFFPSHSGKVVSTMSLA